MMRIYHGVASRYSCGLPGFAPFFLSHAEQFKDVPRGFPKKCWLHERGSWQVIAHDKYVEFFFRSPEGSLHKAAPPMEYTKQELYKEVMRGHLVVIIDETSFDNQDQIHQ